MTTLGAKASGRRGRVLQQLQGLELLRADAAKQRQMLRLPPPLPLACSQGGAYVREGLLAIPCTFAHGGGCMCTLSMVHTG